MAWEPPAEPQPPVGWWHELETAEEWETRRWVEGIAAERRAERIEGLKAAAHQVDMKAAGALARDRWDRIQRRRDQRSVRSHGAYQMDRGVPAPRSPTPAVDGSWTSGDRCWLGGALRKLM